MRTLNSHSLVYHLNRTAYLQGRGNYQEHKEIFRLSRNNYGTRKIKVELKLGYQVSRKRISRLMKKWPSI